MRGSKKEGRGGGGRERGNFGIFFVADRNESFTFYRGGERGAKSVNFFFFSYICRSSHEETTSG